jgi:hypothetical protein
MSDIEIAQKANIKPIINLVKDRFGIAAEHLDPNVIKLSNNPLIYFALL